MDILEELRISREQPVVTADTEEGEFFKMVVDDLEEKGFSRFQNIYALMSVAYNFGVVQGKRAERARRKRGTVA